MTKHNASKSARAWKRDFERAQQLEEEADLLTQLQASLDALQVHLCKGGCGARVDRKGMRCINCHRGRAA